MKILPHIPFIFSYEPEIHPGATVRLSNKAVLKVFTTGSITLTGRFFLDIDRSDGKTFSSSSVCRSYQYGSQ